MAGHRRFADRVVRHPGERSGTGIASPDGGRRRDGHRGSTVLEAALVTPIFLVLVMAVFEVGLYMQTDLAVANTVRAGARTASASGADVNADLHILYGIANESTAIPRDAIEYIVVYRADDFGATPTELGEDGITPGCLAGYPVAGRCNVYTPADFDRAAAQMDEIARIEAEQAAGLTPVRNEALFWFGCQTTGPRAGQSPDRFWCPTQRNVAHSSNGGQGPDFVGVYMKVDHRWLSRFFGDSAEIGDLSVVRLEPREM